MQDAQAPLLAIGSEISWNDVKWTVSEFKDDKVHLKEVGSNRTTQLDFEVFERYFNTDGETSSENEV